MLIDRGAMDRLRGTRGEAGGCDADERATVTRVGAEGMGETMDWQLGM